MKQRREGSSWSIVSNYIAKRLHHGLKNGTKVSNLNIGLCHKIGQVMKLFSKPLCDYLKSTQHHRDIRIVWVRVTVNVSLSSIHVLL